MNPDMTVVAAFARRALDHPDSPAIRDDADAVLDAATVWRQASGLATLLREGGTRPGDRVGWSGRNDPGFLVTLLAAHLLHAVFVPFNFRATGDELHGALALVEPQAVVAHRDTAPPRDGLGLPSRTWVEWPCALPDEDATPAGPPPDPDDLAVLVFTSGSSGRPKAVMLSHANLWWSARNLEATLDLRPDDVTLAVAPLFHIGGLNAFTLSTLRRGGTVVVRRSFDAARTLADLTCGGITSVFGVPSMYAAVARCPGFEDADLSPVRAALVGGAPVPSQLVRAYAGRHMRLYPSWGMTEAAPSGTLLTTATGSSATCSVGRPLPHLRLRLVDPATDEVIDGPGRGEIAIAGPQVTRGYWRDPAATADAITEGWLRTGDLAVRDDEGSLCIVGRIGDVINTGGEKVNPGEVEEALAVLEVSALVVVGVPDPIWGEVVVAVVEGDRQTVPSLAQLRTLAAGHLATYKLPKHLVVVPDLPRTASGKVDRCAARSLAAAHLAGAPAEG